MSATRIRLQIIKNQQRGN